MHGAAGVEYAPMMRLLCAAACLVQMSRPGWLFPVAGLVVLIVVWWAGSASIPRCCRSSA